MHPRPADFDTLSRAARASPARRRPCVNSSRAQLDETGCNYVVGQFAFGDLTLDETLRSVDLFAADVMPALRADATAQRATPASVA